MHDVWPESEGYPGHTWGLALYSREFRLRRLSRHSLAFLL